MISTEVQALLAKAKETTSLVASVDTGLKALQKQNADLQAQVAALPVGQSLSQEDKDGLAEATSNLDTSIAMLRQDIPANTEATDPGKPAPAIKVVGGQLEPGAPVGDPNAPAPDLSNDSGHAADADAANQAKPLGGTAVGPA